MKQKLKDEGFPQALIDNQIKKEIKDAFANGVLNHEPRILPYATKFGDEYYYLPTGYDVEPTPALLKNNGVMTSIVNGFVQNVASGKNGGNDKDGLYEDDKSHLEVEFYDVSAGSKKTVDIGFESLSPYSNLSSDKKTYSINGGKNGLSGCFFLSTVMHDDRCLPMFATYPVLDPAASVEPFLSSNVGAVVKNDDGTFSYTKGYMPGNVDNSSIVYSHQFPIGKKVVEGKEGDLVEGQNDNIAYKTHAEVFQLPSDITTKQELAENIDDMYMDACFNMLPSNSDDFPPGTTGNAYVDIYFYNNFVNSAQSFVDGEGRKNQNIPYGGKGDNISLYKSTNEMVLDQSTKTSLGIFARYYGLYDGIDNDSDGIPDFRPIKDAEGKDSGFELDMDESDPKYGLNLNNIPEVSRALLGFRLNWKNPPYQSGKPGNDEYWYPLPRVLFGKGTRIFNEDIDLILKVKPKLLKSISSLIFHNEPTNYTISKQIESGVTPSLPIDDPRYVAFMDSTGQTSKVNYPNLLKSPTTESAPNVSQFIIDLGILADEILKIPGSQKKLDDFIKSEGLNLTAKDYIKTELFNATINSEKSAYTTKNHADFMLSADQKILRDAINWNSLSIDDKHEYILNYYLNDSSAYPAYINDDGIGYEAAYLIFDGGSGDSSDYIDFAFNKGENTDNDPELSAITDGMKYEDFVGPGIGDDGYPEDGDDDEFVSLKKFFEELINFFKDLSKLITSFDPKVGLDSACGELDIGCDDACEDDTLEKLELIPSKSVVYSDGRDYVDVQVKGYNQNDKPYAASTPALTYSLSQDLLNPSFVVDENYSSKTLIGGLGVIRLRSTNVSGSVTITVQAIVSEETTVETEGLLVQSAGKKVSLTSDTSGAQVGTDEVINLSAALMANEEIEGTATNQVTFTIIDGKDSAVFEGGNIKKAVNGIAKATIKPLTKSGIIKVEAKVTDGPFYATEVKELVITSGEPAKLALETDTNVLLANKKSKANVAVKVVDKYGNLTADQFSTVSIFAFGDVVLDMTGDSNSLMPGLQKDTTDGVANASILSGDKIGEANVYAVLMSDEIEEKMLSATMEKDDIDFKGGIGASRNISILGDGSLKLIPIYNEKINADGNSASAISVELQQTNGIKVPGYNAEIVWDVNDSSYGTLDVYSGKTMTAGVSKAIFKSTTLSGDPTITVSAPGFASITFVITTLPGPATSLSLASDDETLFTGGIDNTLVTAKLLDQYGNLAYTSSANVSFAPSRSSGSILTFDSPNEVFTSTGLATVNIKSTANSGKASISATAPNLEKSNLLIDFKKRISNENSNSFAKISPRALYINLLGGAFYDMGKNDLASEMLFNGKSQAVLTSTSVLNDKKRVVSVDGFGQVDVLDQNVKMNFVPATETFKFNKIKFRDETFGVDVGEIFFVPKNDLPFGLITDDLEKYGEGVFVKDITPDDKKDISPKLISDLPSNSIVLKRGVTEFAKIDRYGRVSLLSNDVVLRLPQAADSALKLDKSYFSMLLTWKNVPIAQIQFRQSVPVSTLKSSDKNTNFEAGIYIKLANDKGIFDLKESFSRYSTEFKRGFYIIDTTQDIDRTMAPGSGVDSIESAKTNTEVGFSTDNKNMLLFTAGNSVGESNIPYASESGIILGDPTIRIDNATEDLIGFSNYTKDIGQMIHSDADTFDNIEFFDYNGDGFDDLLMTFLDGRIKLLENENSNQRFVDRGIILNISNKINSLSKIDINKDGFDDLIVGTQESCVQGEKCLYLYTNKNGSFERQKLELNTADKISSVKTADLNKDGTEDLVISDGAGNVYIFWVDDGKVNSNEYKLGNFGVDLNSEDLIDDILFHYPSMPAIPKAGSSNLDDQKNYSENYGKFVQIKLVQESLATDASSVYNMFGDNAEYDPDAEPLIKPLPFLLAKYTDGVFDGSVKKVVDQNGGSMGIGDIVEYTITIKNNSSSAIRDLIISDITPGAQEIDMDSLKCIDPDCANGANKPEWVGTDAVLRELAIKGLNVPANGVRNLTYTAKITAIPDINIVIGNFANLVDIENANAKIGADESVNDEFLDIFIKPEINDGKSLTYFFSKKDRDEMKHVTYVKYDQDIGATDRDITAPVEGLTDEENAVKDEAIALSEAVKKGTADPDKFIKDASEVDADDPNGDGQDPLDIPLPNGSPESMAEFLSVLNEDLDGDMLPDSWDDSPGSDDSDSKSSGGGSKSVGQVFSDIADMAEKIVDKVEDALDQMRCSGAGCLPIPWNYAFFAPSDQNPGNGIAMLAVGTPNMPYFSFLYPTTAQSNFRLYVSPTLTMGLGVAVCMGPSPEGACFVAAVPAAKIPFICDAIEFVVSKIRSAINKAVSVVNDAVNKVNAIVSGDDSPDATAENSGSNAVNHNGAYGSDNSKLTFKDSVNLKVPGFPGFFTNWMDAQIDEIFTKLLDLPDFYLILPDFDQLFKEFNSQDLAGSFKGMKNVDDFFEAIQKIPLLKIQPEEVTINIPIINKQQIEKYEKQAKQLVENLESQAENIKEFWTCDESSEEKTICESLFIRLDKLIANLKKLLDTLEAYKDLPKTLAKLRFALSKYALQIVCYLDAVMELTGGYINRQGKIIQSWLRAIREIIDQFKGWKAILDLVLDYQVSCDECKNERYGEIGLIFQVFGSVFPELPIIQIPKWPDFVFDFSKIEMGMTVIWPDFVFKPLPLNLPDLPSVTIPNIKPSLDIDLDSLIPDFELPLPNINFDLPDLPPLPLPKLPDIPRPPTIPKIPKPVFQLAVSLKPIFKILCLIKKGLMIYPEGKVKGQIEGMTEPGVKPVLPITLNLNLKPPSFSYDAPVEFDITLKTKFGIDTNGIYEYVKYAADMMNETLSYWSSKFNKYMKAATNAASSATQVDRILLEQTGVSPNWSVDLEKVKEEMKGSYNFNMDDPDNLYYYLAATQDFISDNNPLLEKSASDFDMILATDSSSSEIVELRNSLLAYARGLEEQGNMFENINGLEDLNTLIASLPKNEFNIDEKFVANDLGQGTLNSDSDDIVVKKVSIAADLGSMPLSEMSDVLNEGPTTLNEYIGEGGLTADNLGSIPQTTPKGIFVMTSVDEDGNPSLQNENVVSYTAEINKNTKILFGDVDADTDTDIIYTMGNDVYWKKNYEVNKAPPSNPDVFMISSVSAYSGSVKSAVQTSSDSINKNNSSTFTFLPQKYNDLVGYEVVVYPSLTDIDNDVYRGTYRYLLIEEPDSVLGKVTDVVGVGKNFINGLEKVVHQSPDEFNVSAGDIIYTISKAGIVIDGKNIGLPAGSFYKIPSDIETPTLGLALGTIEYIQKNTEPSDRLLTKTSFVYGEKIRALNNGGASLSFDNGVTIDVKENESFEMMKLNSPESPSITLNIPNGNYFGVIYSLHADGTRSLPSTPSAISPQICGTTMAPLPVAPASLEVPVTKVVEFNAKGSFDPSGAGIKAYYIDTDLTKDNNDDGDKTNDPDLWSDLSLSLDGPDADGNLTNDMTNPIFKLGPFEDVGEMQVTLNVVNNANIAAQQDIKIIVYIPKIALEPVLLSSAFITGSTNPGTSDMPYTLMRKRYLPRVENGVLKLVLNDSKLVTPSANADGQYETKENGTYEVNDFALDDIIYITDSAGNVVVEIDLKTGNFEIKKDGYKYSVYDANPPSESGKVIFKDPDGNVVGTMYFVGDPNFEVGVEDVEEFTTENVNEFYGVHVSQPGNDALPDDNFEFRKYPANDPNYPDGVYLYYLNEGKQVAAIDTAGNILSLDKRITIGKKQNNYTEDPFIHVIRFNGVKIAEVYISPKGKFDEVQIIGPNDVPKKFPNGVSPAYLFEEQSLDPNIVKSSGSQNTDQIFTDLSGDLYEFAMNLYKQGLLGPNTNFNPDALISRQDFVLLLLNMLCIVPRDEAYTDSPVFSDVRSNPWIKEAAMLGLIKGYEDYDDNSLNPFMPDKTINLAEAIFIIVNGLKLIEVIDGEKLSADNANSWYEVYMDAALNLNKYVLPSVLLKNSFIVTQDEAVNPGQELTRGKSLEIAYRVLDAYNCTIIDKNNNGMSDYCEAKYKITDPNADTDNDGLINRDECRYGTDPTNPDTDDGGVKDGDEVRLGTNPLDPIDDQNDTDGDGLTDQEELNVYKTDPNKADTDNGGINDGTEVKTNKTNPLDGSDDYTLDDKPEVLQVYETEAGVYLVPGNCDSCPCISSVGYKSDLRKGDILYTIIVNKNETKIYSKSNEQKVE